MTNTAEKAKKRLEQTSGVFLNKKIEDFAPLVKRCLVSTPRLRTVREYYKRGHVCYFAGYMFSDKLLQDILEYCHNPRCYITKNFSDGIFFQDCEGKTVHYKEIFY